MLWRVAHAERIKLLERELETPLQAPVAADETEPEVQPSEQDLREADDIVRWYDNPVLFATEAFGLSCWSRQREMLYAVAENDNVAVRSGHKVSKSCSAAVLAWWWAVTRKAGRVVLTAPGMRQVTHILWRELWALHRLSQKIGRVRLPKPPRAPETGVHWEDGREIVGITGTQKETIAGYSGPDLMFIVDEASGVAEDIFETIEGNRAGDAKLLLLSQPTQMSGTFYDAFHGQRALWKCIHISSAESPNVVEGAGTIPGLATEAWIEGRKKAWPGGKDNPLYCVRVLGDFPPQAAQTAIPLWAVLKAEAAWRRGRSGPGSGPLSYGLDCARFGDDETILAERRGLSIRRLLKFQPRRDHPDGLTAEQQISDWVIGVVVGERFPGEPKPQVNVDASGVGAGTYSVLVQSDVLRAVDVYTGDPADGDANQLRFTNLRAQLWFAAAEILREGGTIPKDDLLSSDLVAVRYKYDKRNRYQIEQKEELKKRIKRSPDRGDAVVLAYYETAGPPIPDQGGGLSKWDEMPARGY